MTTTVNHKNKVLPNPVNVVNNAPDIITGITKSLSANLSVNINDFTSDNNEIIKNKEANTRKIKTSLTRTIKPNNSVNIIVNYENSFYNTPFALYSIICPDNYFKLNHYINNITKDNISIIIENTSNKQRDITINLSLEIYN